MNSSSRPLNILRVITWLPVGGIERKILAILPRLDPTRFRVRVVCLRERGALASELEAAGIPVELCPMNSRLSPHGLANLTALIRRYKIDIVHAHMYRSNVPATIAAHLARVPVVIAQVHNVDTWESRRQRWIDRLLCRWRTNIIAVSEEVRRDIVENLHVPREKVKVIYNGVDLTLFSDRSLREPTRFALGLAPKDTTIIYHGRLVAQKNPEILLKIGREVALRRGKRVQVIIAGDGPLRSDLEAEAARMGLEGNVRFLGRRNDIPALLQAADIAVLPSFKEGFSNALIEAMAAGLPIVATNVGGNAEAIIHGRNGWIVPSRNDGAFLNAVSQLVDDPEERERMAVQATLMVKRFSLERMLANTENLYTELATNAGLLPPKII